MMATAPSANAAGVSKPTAPWRDGDKLHNAILLLDYVAQLRQRGRSLQEAILEWPS